MYASLYNVYIIIWDVLPCSPSATALYVSLFAWSPWSISCCGQQEVYPCMASMLPRTSCACSSASMLGMKLWFLIVSPYISPCKWPAAYAGVNLWSEPAEAHGVPMNDVKFYNTHKPFNGEWDSFADSKSEVTVFRWRKTDKITNKRCTSSSSNPVKQWSVHFWSWTGYMLFIFLQLP